MQEIMGFSQQKLNWSFDKTSYLSHCWGQWLPTKEKEKELDIPLLNEKVSKNIELDLAAQHGEKGAACDGIVLNAGIVDHLLGCEGAEDVTVAKERAKEAIDSGKGSRSFWITLRSHARWNSSSNKLASWQMHTRNLESFFVSFLWTKFSKSLYRM